MIPRRAQKQQAESATHSSLHLQAYAGHFLLPDGTPYVGGSQRPAPGAPNLLGTTDDIENLRPKSPVGGRNN